MLQRTFHLYKSHTREKLPGNQEVCWIRYLFTSMHLWQMASAIGLLRKMEVELEINVHLFSGVRSQPGQKQPVNTSRIQESVV